MGPLFALAFQLIALFILASIASVFAGVTTFILAKLKRKRKTLIAIILPHIILFSLYLVLLGGNIFISSQKNVDLGIGDSWFVPLGNNYELVMIDITDYASIYAKGAGEPILDNVTHARINGDSLLVRIGQSDYDYRRLILSSGVVQFVHGSNLNKESMMGVEEFYRNQWWKVTGYLPYILGLVGILTPIILSLILIKLVLHDWPFVKSWSRTRLEKSA